MGEIKLLIFDFDGTIVDSKSLYYYAIERYLARSGFRKKNIDRAIDLGLSMSETLRNLGFNFISRIITRRRIISEVLDQINSVKKCHDASAIKNIKTRKILVSNSLDEFIYPVLKHLKLGGEFDEIYGADDFENKTEFIQDYLYQHWLKPEEVMYIGDRVADVRLAKKVGCISVIVTGKCAWSSRKKVIQAEPDFILDDIIEIKDIIGN